MKGRERKRVCVRQLERANARQSGTERWNDPAEGSEGQDVNLNVTKAREKMLFYARAEIALSTVITQSKCDLHSVRGTAEALR